MKNIKIKGNISKKLLSFVENDKNDFNGKVLRVGKEEGLLAITGKDNCDCFIDEILLSKLAFSVVEVIKKGKIGNVQSMDIALNFPQEIIKDKIWSHIYFGALICGNRVIKSCIEESDKGYYHGFSVFELENGSLIRLMYTSAPEMQKEYLHIYGNVGEIRLDLINNKATSYIQSPDYAGDEIVILDNIDQILSNDLSSYCLDAEVFSNIVNI